MTHTSLLARRSIKSAASISRSVLGFPRVSPGVVNIIAYHRVVSDIGAAEQNTIHGIVIGTATFRRHCEMLRRAFDVVSLETAVHFLDDKVKVGRPMAVLTFDDGYRDFYDEAFPILNEFGLPATVFLPTAYMGQDVPLAHDRIFWLLKQAMRSAVSIGDALRRAGMDTQRADALARCRSLPRLTDSLVYLPSSLRENVIVELERELGGEFEGYPRDYQLLDWEMIREMSRKGIDFGAHTANHVVLPLENESVATTEINESRNTLEDKLGKKIVSFAYPNGEHNKAIRQIVSNAGFRVAVTTAAGTNHSGSDLLALGRTSLCEESTRGFWGTYSHGVADLRLGI